jgi:membrane protease YdiL (CAAX protease family)
MTEISSKKIRLIELLLVVLIPLLPSVISSLYSVSLGLHADIRSDSSSNYGLITTGTKQLLSITLLIYILFRQGRSIEDIGFSFRWIDMLIGIGIYAVAHSIYYCLYKWGHHLFPNADVKAHNLGFFSGTYLLIFLFSFINPFYEELIVRAYAMTEIEFLTGNKIAPVIIVTIFQSSYHLYQGVFPALMTIPIFLTYSIYFARYKRIMPVIIAHLIADMVAMVYHLR